MALALSLIRQESRSAVLNSESETSMSELREQTNRAALRALCVDNDTSTCEMLTELLKQSGLDVTATDRSVAALHAIKTGWFDLYLLDAYLPDIDGFELCRRIREYDRRVPILFYSGAAQESDIARGMAAGANAFIIKPEIKGLLKTINRLMPRALPPLYRPELPIKRMTNSNSLPQVRKLVATF